jgi:response regulator RpfG family c-di-GMP phosphodiesterase
MEGLYHRTSPSSAGRTISGQAPTSPPLALCRDLLSSGLVLPEDWEALSPDAREELNRCTNPEALLPKLVRHGLLTRYQAERLGTGNAHGLILGNYRVLDRLGTGGMGVVFRAEHLGLRKFVAIKVLSLSADENAQGLQRFYAEMRAVARLQHPNIVAVTDAGQYPGSGTHAPTLHYFVMEYLNGMDLEAYVRERGPLAPAEACDLAYQIASALTEAERHHLVHRDVKPSNVLVTPDGQAKLLDFGVARQPVHRLTEHGTVLGSLAYMAPEQFSDPRKVDIRADIYGLGGVLFWCLTGQTPFPPGENLAQEVAGRLSPQPAPSARACRADVPEALDAIIAHMMAVAPDQRYPTPRVVMRTLIPFVDPDLRDYLLMPQKPAPGPPPAHPDGSGSLARVHEVLIADDEPQTRDFCKFALDSGSIRCDHAEDGVSALAALRAHRYDLVILDMDMPGMSGPEICTRLREAPPYPHLKVIMISGGASPDELAQIMLASADDYLPKPFSVIQLKARVKAALRLKDAQDRTDLLTANLLATNQDLEQNLHARDSDLVQARNALVLALAELVNQRDGGSGMHLWRLQRYCRTLAEAAAGLPKFAGTIDANLIDLLEGCAPLHDIGKVGLPDHILLKPGKLTPDERVHMQTHTTIGADMLQKVADQHGFARVFLQTAVEVVRYHHERYDGQGYPDGLAGEAIPLVARIVTIADVYDALRCRRAHKPALSHATTVRLMTEDLPGHFDPVLLQVFQRCAAEFERIFRRSPE